MCVVNRTIELATVQKKVAKTLLAAISHGSVLVLECASGMGRTTILRDIHATAGGEFVGLREFTHRLMKKGPFEVEETLLELIESALKDHELVIVDDLQILREIPGGYNLRDWMLDAVLTVVLDEASREERKLLFGVDDGWLPSPVARRARVFKMDKFTPGDYAQVCRRYLPAEAADRLDFAQIHRFAPLLNVWQLRNTSSSLACNAALDTAAFMDYLSEHDMTSNVEAEEVRQVDWTDLKGIDDVVRALEAKIALPFENQALATELNLRARRGVLLAGPPGTGKTTIGRALARRLKGKFFLIDGTAIAGSGEFYETVGKVFNAATQNAPSVIFIDDADVIFEDKGDRGLYRYLLTKLDGLESASSDRVCVMMTAMDAGCLPAALLRSGRIELWLETRLPDTEARMAIVRESLKGLPPPLCDTDAAALASASQGLTGADLKSVIEDGKLLLAHDKVTGTELRPVEEYFLQAIETVRSNRRNYIKRKPGPFGEDIRIGFGAA